MFVCKSFLGDITMFTIDTVRNLKWVDQEHTAFTCNVKYLEFDEEHPVGVVPTDTYQHIQDLWNNGITGVYGTIEEYVEPPAPPLTELQIARRAAKAVLADPNSSVIEKATANVFLMNNPLNPVG